MITVDVSNSASVLLAIIGVVIMSFGYLFQKIGLKEFQGIRSFYKNKYGFIWMTGTFLTFGGSLLFFIALGFGDITIIQPITGLSPAIVTVLGVVVFNTVLHRNEVLGIILSVVGIIFVSYRVTGQVQSLFISELILNYFSIGASISILLLVLALNWLPSSDTGLIEGILAGITTGLSSIYAKIGLNYLIDSGIFHWSILAFIVLQTAAFISLQRALSHGRMDKIVTIFTSISILLPVGFGIIFLAEMINFLNILGMIMILIGVILLAKNYSEIFVAQTENESI